jgi:voltage-gated potassium channel
MFLSAYFTFNIFKRPKWDALLIIPFELFLMFSPLKYLSLLALARFYLIKKNWNDLSRDGLFSQRHQIAFIGLGVCTLIHAVAMIWMSINSWPGESTSDIYIKSLYWAVTTLTTTGYGDITPTNNLGRLFTIIVMLGGFSAFGLMVGNVSNMLMARSRLQEANKEKMENLSLFLRHYKIPAKLQGEVHRYYRHKLQNRLSENDSLIVADLPLSLQNEIHLYMRVKLISEIPVFTGLPSECLILISQSLEQVSFTGGEEIISIGTKGEEMFIIDHGEVQVVNEHGHIVANLKHGQCFGEVALLQETHRTAGVRAITYCDTFKLSKKNFENISREFPELLKNMTRIMLKRRVDLRVA